MGLIGQSSVDLGKSVEKISGWVADENECLHGRTFDERFALIDDSPHFHHVGGEVEPIIKRRKTFFICLHYFSSSSTFSRSDVFNYNTNRKLLNRVATKKLLLTLLTL